MKNLNVIKSMKEWNLKDADYGTYYFEEEKLSLHLFDDSIRLIQLENAQKTGKTCRRIAITQPWNWRESIKTNILNNIICFNHFIAETLKDPEIPKSLGYTVSVSEIKGVRVFSPFVQIKKIKEPKKWTLRHFVKAVYSGQIQKGECTGYYTDDYAWDTANNYGRGQINPMAIAKEVIESPDGWWISSEKEGKQTILTVCCHHFNNNKFIFVE